ncbi:hypothetical protein NE237_003787 [Protea cynaroides]|uniref:Uncharacterized protein n=1 Tax=Protea cynaroides TaxID=273540 RepID=A0A9Q0KHG6_9MAGN|nr:hypothetical protein NE237_003787 [Protea cynaroides]
MSSLKKNPPAQAELRNSTIFSLIASHPEEESTIIVSALKHVISGGNCSDGDDISRHFLFPPLVNSAPTSSFLINFKFGPEQSDDVQLPLLEANKCGLSNEREQEGETTQQQCGQKFEWEIQEEASNFFKSLFGYNQHINIVRRNHQEMGFW